MPLQEIIAGQELWARKRWPGHTGRRAPSLDENLVVEMSSLVQQQFSAGSGGELDRDGRLGKMRSLRSSSALGFNVFAPWIGDDLEPLGRALGVTLADNTVVFERQFKHGLNSIPPNIDIVLDNLQDRPLGIESKFTEPYGPRPIHKAIDAKYFANDRERWAELGLPKCQRLAAEVGSGVVFRRLGAGQLLKHILGLAYSTKRAPRLLCVWYDNGCKEAGVHRTELARFAELIDESIEFASHTYQQVLSKLGAESEPVPGYLEYLQTRYHNVDVAPSSSSRRL